MNVGWMSSGSTVSLKSSSTCVPQVGASGTLSTSPASLMRAWRSATVRASSAPMSTPDLLADRLAHGEARATAA